jgi:glyoxylase-like metal-dependent hydrolase (beta-lactamase superfamily II)
LVTSVFVLASISCKNGTVHESTLENWCDHPTRSGLEKLKERKTSRPWFRVFEVGDGVLAITEPYQSQEVNSFLILGKDKALLFDTGMGMDTLSALVKELTTLPVIVLNSHTHPDHIGGNHEFDSVLAMNTAFTDRSAKEGYGHKGMRSEITPDAFCDSRLPGLDTALYAIKPFVISRRVADGDSIDLGGRILRILATPGHTPDALALLDDAKGYLWTGDSFYLGPIWLFMEGTDLNAYDHGMHRMAALVPSLHAVFPAHNLPLVEPVYLDSVTRAFNDVMMGKGVAEKQSDGSKLYSFGAFGFRLRGDAVSDH